MEFTAATLEQVAAVHRAVVQADDFKVGSAVGSFYPQSRSLLESGIRYLYPGVCTNDVIECWQDNGFESIVGAAEAVVGAYSRVDANRTSQF